MKRDGCDRGGWANLIELCGEIAMGRQAIRLANLAIAAQVGARAGLLGRRRRLDASGLADAVHSIALEPLVALDPGDLRAWRALADEAARFADTLGETLEMDAWVGSFQSGDPMRKSRGAYATPRDLAGPMARLLLAGGDGDDRPRRILDPAAGAGGLLLAVLRELLRSAVGSREVRRHVSRLHGVELDPLARELGCLLIWLLAAERSVTPARIGERVIVGDAVARDWWSAELFDALIMNPPWDSLRAQRVTASDVANGAAREAMLERLCRTETGHPDLPPLYSAQGRGDRNLYKAFTELAPHLLNEGGRLIALLPGAWSSDLGTAQLRKLYLSHMRIGRWTSFENRRGYFPIDGRYKFGILTGERCASGTGVLYVRAFAADAGEVHRKHTKLHVADLRAIGGTAESVPDLTSARERRLMIGYRRSGIELFAHDGPFGAVRYRREVDLTEDRKRGVFYRLEDLAATPRHNGEWTVAARGRPEGLDQHAADGRLVPLVEGRMVSQYEFYAKSWVRGAGRTAKWSWSNGHPLRECRPQYLIAPRPQPQTQTLPQTRAQPQARSPSQIPSQPQTQARSPTQIPSQPQTQAPSQAKAPSQAQPPSPSVAGVRVAICDVTSATNTRTVLASWIPSAWPCGNTAPVLVFDSEREALAALAVLNSMVFDWFARRIVAGLHLNRFYLDAMAWPRLTSAEVDVLAAAGALLTTLSPRYRELSGTPLQVAALDVGYVEAHTLVEVAVARGYGLTAVDLDEVFSCAQSDRRGLWRHFASDPHALPIAHAARELLRLTARRSSAGARRDRGRVAALPGNRL